MCLKMKSHHRHRHSDTIRLHGEQETPGSCGYCDAFKDWLAEERRRYRVSTLLSLSRFFLYHSTKALRRWGDGNRDRRRRPPGVLGHDPTLMAAIV
ncbi:hypothetical protein LSAT2_029319 [Lamellibrachia satsuma]|nr:hypothetical protein LSAT2_029319 [Lamellibrachia satsuma]